MAHIYVDSAAGGAGTGASWADAYTTLKAAAEAAGTVAGDSIWVAHSHAETSASLVLITFKNTSAAPGTVMCVNKAGSVPPVSADLRTTATVSTTGASSLTLAGFAYVYGIIFNVASGGASGNIVLNSGAGTPWQYYKTCAFNQQSTTTGIRILWTGGRVVWDNTTVSWGNVGCYLDVGNFIWKNTSSAVTGAVIPTQMIRANSAGEVRIEGVDLSAIGAGKTLVGALTAHTNTMLVKNCKLGAGVTLATVPTSVSLRGPVFINCDSGDTNYTTSKYAYEGTQSVETSAVLTDGASDGTTPISWSIVTNANVELVAPFESLPIAIWNETVGARTVTVQGTWNSGGPLPTNAQIWMEVEYLGTASSTQSTFASTGLANILATPANLTVGDGTWAGPASAYTKFKMVQAITPAEKGPISVRVYVAAISQTFYIDPRIVLT